MEKIENFYDMLMQHFTNLTNIDVITAVFCPLLFTAFILFLLMLFKRQKSTAAISRPPSVTKRPDVSSGKPAPPTFVVPSVSNSTTLSKAKDRKTKKLKKQNLEKKSNDSAEESVSDPSSTDSQNSVERRSSRSHVDFADSAGAVPILKLKKNASKKDKVKPILVNKGEKVNKNGEIASIEDPKINNFEEILPKDDFELLRSRSREKNFHTTRKEQANRIKQLKSTGTQSGHVHVEPKKKRSDLLLQINSGQTLNVNLLIQLIQEYDMTRTEIQHLIDTLLNKQQDTPNTNEDWSEGKSDQLQKLKKQLAEKERVLEDEQQAHFALQTKVKDIRIELNNEKSKTTKMARDHDEFLLTKRQELQSLSTHCHSQSQLISKLQSQLNEFRDNEMLLSGKLKDYELHLSEESKQAQSQLMTLKSKLQELQDVNLELQSLREQDVANKDMLHNRISLLESQLIHYRSESDQKQEIVRQLEESRRLYAELEHRLGATHRKEAELKIELNAICQQKAEVVKKTQCEISYHKQLQEDNEKIISQLKSDNSRLMESKQAKLIEAQDLNNKIIELNKKYENKCASIKDAADQAKIREIELINKEAANLKMKSNEIQNLKKEMVELTRILETNKISKIELDEKIEKLQNDNDILESQYVSSKKSEESKLSEIQQLKSEIDRLNNRLEMVSVSNDKNLNEIESLNREIVRISENDQSAFYELTLKTTKVELETLKDDVKRYQNEINDLRDVLSDRERTIGELKCAVSDKDVQLTQIQNDLQDQINKNNDLRTKNWKTIEALKDAEIEFKQKLESVTSDHEELLVKKLQENGKLVDVFMSRTFSNIQVPPRNNEPLEVYLRSVESSVKEYLDSLNEKLREHEKLMVKYDQVVDKTNEILVELENKTKRSNISIATNLANGNDDGTKM